MLTLLLACSSPEVEGPHDSTGRLDSPVDSPVDSEPELDCSVEPVLPFAFEVLED